MNLHIYGNYGVVTPGAYDLVNPVQHGSRFIHVEKKIARISAGLGRVTEYRNIRIASRAACVSPAALSRWIEEGGLHGGYYWQEVE